MDQASRAAFIVSQAACMHAELEAMKIHRQQDLDAGRSPTYHAGDFEALPDRYGLGHNAVVEYLR